MTVSAFASLPLTASSAEAFLTGVLPSSLAASSFSATTRTVTRVDWPASNV